MKKLLSLILAGIISISASTSVLAGNIGVVINGKNANFKSSPFMSQDRVFVPMRDLFETIGAKVSWDDHSKSAIASLENKTICFQIGSHIVTQDGVVHFSDVACQLVDDKTYVPLRIILELLDFTVNWDGENNEVEIGTPPSADLGGNENNQQIGSASEFELKVIELVNIERTNNGLSALSWDSSLADVARAHSKDMATRNFFDHTNPDGKSPFDRMRAYGISYMAAAENIAAGQNTPEEVVEGWMNSPGHRANILNGSYNKLGVGYYKSNSGYGHYWTQCFTN